jgi:hypothetical protein
MIVTTSQTLIYVKDDDAEMKNKKVEFFGEIHF